MAGNTRLSRTLRPLAAPPGPPPDAVTPVFVFDKPGGRSDIAAVFLVADWQSVADQRMGLYVGDPRLLQSQRFTAYGYGINDPDALCGVNHSSVGAGIARSGSDFIGTTGRVDGNGQPALYEFSPVSTNNQAIMCGDSMLGENPSTHNVEMVARDSEQRTTVTYDVPTKRIQMNGRCLSAVSGFIPPPASLAACNASDPAQIWNVNPNGQISNPRTGKCLVNGSWGVALGACVVTLNGRPVRPSSTMWSFRAQL